MEDVLINDEADNHCFGCSPHNDRLRKRRKRSRPPEIEFGEIRLERSEAGAEIRLGVRSPGHERFGDGARLQAGQCGV